MPGSFRTGVTCGSCKITLGGYASHSAGTGRHSASRHVTRISSVVQASNRLLEGFEDRTGLQINRPHELDSAL